MASWSPSRTPLWTNELTEYAGRFHAPIPGIRQSIRKARRPGPLAGGCTSPDRIFRRLDATRHGRRVWSIPISLPSSTPVRSSAVRSVRAFDRSIPILVLRVRDEQSVLGYTTVYCALAPWRHANHSTSEPLASTWPDFREFATPRLKARLRVCTPQEAATGRRAKTVSIQIQSRRFAGDTDLWFRRERKKLPNASGAFA